MSWWRRWPRAGEPLSCRETSCHARHWPSLRCVTDHTSQASGAFMERPLEIFFHNMETSKEIEAEIRRAVDQLDKRGGLIGCRVTIDTPHRQHKTGNIYSVHIVLSVDGSD